MNHSMKQIVACLLAVCILAVSVPLCADAEKEPLQLMVAADTHFRCAADLGAPDDTYAEYLLDPDTFAYAST